MFKIRSIALGGVAGALATWGAFNYHVLRTNQGLVWSPKTQVSLTDTYVDVRGWSLVEWGRHPNLVRTLTENGQQDIISEGGAIETTLREGFESLRSK